VRTRHKWLLLEHFHGLSPEAEGTGEHTNALSLGKGNKHKQNFSIKWRYCLITQLLLLNVSMTDCTFKYKFKHFYIYYNLFTCASRTLIFFKPCWLVVAGWEEHESRMKPWQWTHICSCHIWTYHNALALDRQLARQLYCCRQEKRLRWAPEFAELGLFTLTWKTGSTCEVWSWNVAPLLIWLHTSSASSELQKFKGCTLIKGGEVTRLPTVCRLHLYRMLMKR